MKLLCALVLLVANALCAFADLPIPLPPPNVPLDLVPEYLKLFKLCNDGGDNSYVGVLYQDGSYVTYNFGQCYPYELSDGTTLAKMAVFCKTSTCFNNPNPDCTGGAVPPVPVPVPVALTLVNAEDFVQLIGQGATCQRGPLS